MMRENKGFTLIEITVAMLIGFVIVSMAGVTFLFLWERVVQWKVDVKTTNTYHLIMRTLHDDLVMSRTAEIRDSTLFLYKEKETISYYSDRGRLMRDHRSMNDGNFRLDSISYLPVFHDSGQNILNLSGDEHLQQPFDRFFQQSATGNTPQMKSLKILLVFQSNNKQVKGQLITHFNGTHGWETVREPALPKSNIGLHLESLHNDGLFADGHSVIFR